MPHVPNRASVDLEVAGRVFAAGLTVEVGETEARIILSNPNFMAAADPVADDPIPSEKPVKGGRKA